MSTKGMNLSVWRCFRKIINDGFGVMKSPLATRSWLFSDDSVPIKVLQSSYTTAMCQGFKLKSAPLYFYPFIVTFNVAETSLFPFLRMLQQLYTVVFSAPGTAINSKLLCLEDVTQLNVIALPLTVTELRHWRLLPWILKINVYSPRASGKPVICPSDQS